MPAERVAMRQAREIIRLKFSANIPTREIARRLGLAPSTVRETLKRFEVSGLGWPLPEGTSESELEAALYANRRGKRGHRRHEEPDWRAVRTELKLKHVTLLIVWDEYIAANPGGYSYSRFCDLYRNWEAAWTPAPPADREGTAARRRSPCGHYANSRGGSRPLRPQPVRRPLRGGAQSAHREQDQGPQDRQSGRTRRHQCRGPDGRAAGQPGGARTERGKADHPGKVSQATRKDASPQNGLTPPGGATAPRRDLFLDMLSFALAPGMGELLKLPLAHGFLHLLGGAFELGCRCLPALGGQGGPGGLLLGGGSGGHGGILSVALPRARVNASAGSTVPGSIQRGPIDQAGGRSSRRLQRRLRLRCCAHRMPICTRGNLLLIAGNPIPITGKALLIAGKVILTTWFAIHEK